MMLPKRLAVFKRNKLAVVGTVGAIILLLTAVFGPLIVSNDPLEQDPYHTLESPRRGNLFGTDNHGRDILSRVIYGARVSLLVSITAIALGLAVGTTVGITAGYLGGVTEIVIMRTVDVMMCIPSLILGIAIMAILGSGLSKVIFCIAIVMAPRFARLAYGSTLGIKHKEYIESARSISAPRTRIFLFHILPNIFGEILVVAVLWMGTAIQIEASLSFIGVGIAPPIPTWGNMIRTGMDYLGGAPWISIFPGLAIFCTIFFFNMLGDGIRDIADPKLYD